MANALRPGTGRGPGEGQLGEPALPLPCPVRGGESDHLFLPF